jgi:hypothetical protein
MVMRLVNPADLTAGYSRRRGIMGGMSRTSTIIETHILNGLTPLGLLIVCAVIAIAFVTVLIVLASFSRRRK